MIHPTPTKALLATTLRPLVVPLSRSLAHGTRLIDHFLHQEPPPQKMATFERELRTLLQEVGRRMMAWVLNHMEPERPEAMPACLWLKGQAYRRRRKHRTTMATLFGTVDVWRRLYAPLVSGSRSLHPLELRLGLEAGVATPALAERLGIWAAEHSQRHGLEMLRPDHGVPWSCPTLRTLLSSLSAGMAPYRQAAQVDRVVGWLPQTRASHGRLQPTLAVGRAGVHVPMRHREWKAGSTATVSVVHRRGQRVGTGYLGQMPAPGQPTLTAQLTALLQDILRQVDAQGLRLVSGSDAGDHPSDSYHSVLKKMIDPKRPWRHLEWIRIVDSYHACLSITPLAEALFGLTAQGRAWAQQMRQSMKTTSDGITRV
jgi:hypothetical protein